MVRDSRTRTLLKYGISPSDYEKMLVAQGGVCAICKKKPGKIRLVTDHDHQIEREFGVVVINGLIHSRENRALGCFEYSDEVLTNLISYCRLILKRRKRYAEEER